MAKNDYDDLLESFMNNSQRLITMIEKHEKRTAENYRLPIILFQIRKTARVDIPLQSKIQIINAKEGMLLNPPVKRQSVF